MSGRQLNCTFCQKPKSDVKALIASPDKLTYICEECTFQPAKLKNILPESTSKTSSTPSGLFGFLRRGQSRGAVKCSFCWKEASLPDLYRSTLEIETQAQICRDCLDVCRQILRQEIKT